MKHLKALPIILYVLQTIPAYAAPVKEHFEILDMTNPAVIREMDRVYVMHPDQNSIQQGIRLYALAIEAWNPSYKNINVRLKIMNHVKDQGVLNGLIAPSILLIEHALKTNDVAFAMSLITMVRHISPVFNSQLERKWKLPETSMNFAKFVTNSDEQISKYYGRLLGSDFQAYADGERKLAETSLRQSFMSSRNSETDLDSLIKKATSKPASRKTTAQDLIQNVVEKGPSKDAFIQDIYKQCLQFSHSEETTFGENQTTKNNARPFEASELRNLTNKCLTTETSQNNNLNNVDLNALTKNTWANESDCNDFLKQDKNAKNQLRNKIEQDRLRYSEVNWTCTKDCALSAMKHSLIGAGLGSAAGGFWGAAIGASFGSTVAILSCQESASCGGDKFVNEKNRLELIASHAKAERELRELENTKKTIADQREKEKADSDRRREQTTKEERERALRDLGINEDDIIKGVDSCNNSSCNTSNITESDPSFSAFARSLEKEDLKRKRIQEFYYRQNSRIETNPKITHDLIDSSSAKLNKCIKDEWNKDFGL
ncbi:MAG: hypothetical protein ACM3MG_11245, partial [Bacillota bacterium]